MKNTKLNYKLLKRDESGRFLPKSNNYCGFQYPSSKTGKRVYRWIKLEEDNKDYILGEEKGQFKKFRKDKIINGVYIVHLNYSKF